MWFYFLIFITLAILSLYKRFDKSQNILYICIAFFFILIVAFRKAIDRDFFIYVRAIFDEEESDISELSFYYIKHFIKFLGLSDLNLILGVFLCYAIIGVSIKVFAIIKLSDFVILSLLVYFSNCFLLHEMTQIRGGVSAAFFLLSIVCWQKKNIVSTFILFVLATIFHNSALFLFIFYFTLNPFKFNKLIYSLLIPGAYFLYFLEVTPLNFIGMINISYIQHKIDIYNEIMKRGVFVYINVFNSIQLFRILLVYVLIYKSDFLSKQNRYFILLLELYVISVMIYVLFYQNPVLSGRMSEYIQTVEIILLPMIVYFFPKKQRILGKIVVICISLVFLLMNLYYSQLLKPYF
jgi:hypothetical protein